MFPLVNEELFWGDAGDRDVDHGHDAGRRRDPNGAPEQWGEWIPQCFGTESDPHVGAFCVSEPDGVPARCHPRGCGAQEIQPLR